MNATISSKVNIGDVLRLALPLKTSVIVGSQYTRRPIEWAVMLTHWDDLITQIEKDDLVILPPSLQNRTTDQQFQSYIGKLADLNIAGLLIFREVSTVVETAASQRRMPLLVAPANASPREAHRAITSLLVDQQTATNERGMQLYRQLSEMSREGQGLAAMTEVISKLTGKIVVVQDKRLDIQAISIPRDTSVDLGELRHTITQREELPAVLRNRKAAAKARQSYWQQLLPIEKDSNMGRLISPIISGDRARGYLSVIGLADELDLLDSLAVEHGAAACALEMAKAKAVSEARKALRGNFLEGLLAGTLPQQEIERLERRLDHDTKQPHAALTFTWAGETTDTPSLRRLETTVNWILNNHNRPALVYIHSKQHICVFQALKDAEDMETVHELARRLIEQVQTEFPKTQLIGGMSGPAITLAEWPRVYTEAVQAMQLSQRLNLSHIVEFNSLGVYRLLSALEDVPTIQSFTDQIIGPLADYDKKHRGNLVQTLDAYFSHHGNISKTAESLFVHRNTLLYRLERIQVLTRQDLDQSDMRLAFHLALKLWQLRPDT